MLMNLVFSNMVSVKSTLDPLHGVKLEPDRVEFWNEVPFMLAPVKSMPVSLHDNSCVLSSSVNLRLL